MKRSIILAWFLGIILIANTENIFAQNVRTGTAIAGAQYAKSDFKQANFW